MTSTKLSKYMVPHHWIPVNYIPRSTSGKIDKKKLVQLAQSLNCKPEKSSKCIIPAETGMERILTKIWSEIFAIEVSQIDRNESFFQVGGNSISAIHLIERLRKQSVSLSVSSVFENPVMKDMALSCHKIEQKVPPKTNEPVDKFLPYR
jgi:aryl carrier-like protein